MNDEKIISFIQFSIWGKKAENYTFLINSNNCKDLFYDSYVDCSNFDCILFTCRLQYIERKQQMHVAWIVLSAIMWWKQCVRYVLSFTTSLSSTLLLILCDECNGVRRAVMMYIWCYCSIFHMLFFDTSLYGTLADTEILLALQFSDSLILLSSLPSKLTFKL